MTVTSPKRLSRRAVLAGGVLFTLLAAAFPALAAPKKRLLVVTVTKGFRHADSIPVAEQVIKDLGERSNSWTTDYVRSDEEMAQKMSAQGLKNYDAVFFANTTGDLPIPDRDAFIQWIESGKGFAGAHAAADTFHGYPAYIQMLGGEFLTHGAQVQVNVRVEDAKHPATRHLGAGFQVFDEIYQFKNFDRSRMHGLLTMDSHPNEGRPGDYPVSWARMQGKGRVFYTSLGHRPEVWNTDWYQRHLLGGVRWALGLEKADAKPGAHLIELSSAERRQGFRPLFNGRDLTGWHLRHSDGKASWSVQNGMLVNSGGGTDLVTDAVFGDHVVRYEYLVPKNGNSGFYLRGLYEIQVSDDFEGKKTDIHGNGAVYDKILPTAFASRPAGQWQQAEATLIGNRVTVVLNGVKVIDNTPIEGITGLALENIKPSDPGPFFLQGDHSAVAFRNIRVKPLRSTVSPIVSAAH